MAAPTRWQLQLVWWFIVVKYNASFTFKLRITCPEVAWICKTTASRSVSAKVEGLAFTKQMQTKCWFITTSVAPEGPYDFFQSWNIRERNCRIGQYKWNIVKTRSIIELTVKFWSSETLWTLLQCAAQRRNVSPAQNTGPSSFQRASAGQVICCFNIMLTWNM